MGAKVSTHLLEVLSAGGGEARISQRVVEVLQSRIVPSPTTVTGAGVSQDVIEVLSAASGAARISSHLVEVLSADTNTGAGATAGGTQSFGFMG